MLLRGQRQEPRVPVVPARSLSWPSSASLLRGLELTWNKRWQPQGQGCAFARAAGGRRALPTPGVVSLSWAG